MKNKYKITTKATINSYWTWTVSEKCPHPDAGYIMIGKYTSERHTQEDAFNEAWDWLKRYQFMENSVKDVFIDG